MREITIIVCFLFNLFHEGKFSQKSVSFAYNELQKDIHAVILRFIDHSLRIKIDFSTTFLS